MVGPAGHEQGSSGGDGESSKVPMELGSVSGDGGHNLQRYMYPSISVWPDRDWNYRDVPCASLFQEEEEEQEVEEGKEGGGQNSTEESSTGQSMDALSLRLELGKEIGPEGGKKEVHSVPKSSGRGRRGYNRPPKMAGTLSPRRTPKERAAHSQYERRRRQRISDRIRTLQQLVPNACENDDKASALEKAIQHIKQMQFAVQQNMQSRPYGHLQAVAAPLPNMQRGDFYTVDTFSSMLAQLPSQIDMQIHSNNNMDALYGLMTAVCQPAVSQIVCSTFTPTRSASPARHCDDRI